MYLFLELPGYILAIVGAILGVVFWSLLNLLVWKKGRKEWAIPIRENWPRKMNSQESQVVNYTYQHMKI